MVEQIAGHQLHVHRMGRGAPMLMIHCSLARAEALLRLAGAFEDHQVTLFDLPGHGRSAPAAPDQDVHDLTTQIAAALCDGPTHLVGHSFGATVALRLAVERPDLVSRLSLIEPVYFKAAEGTPAHGDHARAYAPVEAAFAADDLPLAAERFLHIWGGGQPWAQMSPRMQAEILRSLPLVAGSTAAVHEDTAGVLAPGRIEALDVPVRLIRGAQSHPVIGAIHQGLAARLRDVRCAEIAGAGHMVPITHARAVAQVIRGDL